MVGDRDVAGPRRLQASTPHGVESRFAADADECFATLLTINYDARIDSQFASRTTSDQLLDGTRRTS